MVSCQSIIPSAIKVTYTDFPNLLSINEHSVCNITKQSSLVQLIQRATLLVWDEAPMSHKYVVSVWIVHYGTSVLAIYHSVARLWCFGVTFVKSYR